MQRPSVRSFRPAIVRTGLTTLTLSAVLAACATTPPPPPPPPPPSIPAAPEAPTGAVLADWRGVITAADRDRYQRRAAAWSLALEQSRRQTGSGDLASLGDLIDPAATRAGVTPPEGAYRCRTVKLGSQGGDLLFPENDREMVFLGSMALASEPTARAYGQRPERDMVSVLERIGESRWRLVTPWPANESNLDILELVPAPSATPTRRR